MWPYNFATVFSDFRYVHEGTSLWRDWNEDTLKGKFVPLSAILFRSNAFIIRKMDAGKLIEVLRATLDPNQREQAEQQLTEVSAPFVRHVIQDGRHQRTHVRNKKNDVIIPKDPLLIMIFVVLIVQLKVLSWRLIQINLTNNWHFANSSEHCRVNHWWGLETSTCFCLKKKRWIILSVHERQHYCLGNSFPG